MSEKIEKKSKFICETCERDFETKGNLERHLQRKYPCVKNEKEKYKCYKCGKNFNKKSNLLSHQNKKNDCNKHDEDVIEQNQNVEIEENDASIPITRKEITDMLKIQQDFFKQIILNTQISNLPSILNLEQISDAKDMKDTSDVTTTSTNATNGSAVTKSNNSNNHSHNTDNSILTTMQNMSSSCLINYVVNQYPNARNIEDCIRLENIPKSLLIECEDMYFTEGSMKIFKTLCDLGEEHRPIHCTDASRGNFIYKTNDVWKIDIGGEKIKSYFFPVIQEAYTHVHKQRIKNSPGNSTVISNFLTEMTTTNIKKVCQKTLKRLTSDFLAKNSKNSKMIKSQVKQIEQ